MCFIEVLLNSRRGLIDVMIESGIISILGEVVVDETDALALVCSFPLFLFFHSLSHIIILYYYLPFPIL